MFLRRTFMENILNKKVLESALNAFVIALVTQFVDAGADLSVLGGEGFSTILNAAIASAAWVVFRAVNPMDHNFGIGAEPEKAPVKKAAAKKAPAKKK
jgi:hypothetical protein